MATENDLQLSAGGDGTLNLVINGMLRKASDAPCAVGLIPFGIGNDFAGACGIPSGCFLEALDIVLGTSPVHIDVGQVNETFFVNVVAGGFPAQAVAGISRKAKALLGKFAYFVTGLANIGCLAAKTMHFTAPTRGMQTTAARSYCDILPQAGSHQFFKWNTQP